MNKMNTIMKFALFGLLGLADLVACEKRVVCYYGTWATYRPGDGQFNVADVDTELCTHVIYTFVGLNGTDGSIVSLDPWLDLNASEGGGRDNFRLFTGLKENNPNLKTILAIGGWNQGSRNFSIVVADPALRKAFITDAVAYLQKYNFDGLDIDWEYPARRDTVNGQADVDNFTQLLKELQEAFEQEGLSLSIAASAVEQAASISYDIAAISKYVDFVSVMCYDFYGPFDAVTGHNSPLYPGEGDEGQPRSSLFTIENALQYWLAQGAPANKLNLGLPLYGRTFTLTDANYNGLRAPSSGNGIAGQFTREAGTIGYNEFCNLTSTEQWDIRFDSLAKVPYAVRGSNWVSFDDPQSLTTKVDYAMGLGIGGAMVWSIETDDFHGTCNGVKNPLLRAINEALDSKVDGTSTSPDVATTTTEAATEVTTTTTEAATTTTVAASTTTQAVPTTTEQVSTTTEAVSSTIEAATTTTVAASTTTVATSTTTEEVSTTTEAVSTTTEAESTTTQAAPTTTESVTTSTEKVSTTTEEASTTTETVFTTTESSSTEASSSVCGKKEGLVANPEDCSSFYYCVWNEYGLISPILFKCPVPLHWDQKNQYCNWPQYAKCQASYADV